jgi:putative DNA primase/helicase
MAIVDVSITSLQDLKLFPQWVCYIADKTPFQPSGVEAKANDPKTWSSYSEVLRARRRDPDFYAGIGFEFVKEQGLTGVDLDKCIDEEGHLSPYAQRIINLLNSYTEYSPSKRGVHILVRGNIPKNIGPDTDGISKIEMYDCKRYFTITGNHLDGTPDTFEDRQEALLALHQEVTEQRRQAREAKRPQEHKVTRAASIGGDTPYGLAALERECQDVATTHEGGRNTRLNTAAYSLGQLVAGNELSRSTVERELYHAAERCGLPPNEIEKALRSGIEAGMKEPRTSPPAESKYYNPGPTANSNGNRGSVYIAPAPPPPDKPFHLTDLGNAERFALRYKDTVRWCEVWKSWMVFNGKCWEQDKTGRADQLAKVIVRSIYAEASKVPIEDADGSKRIAKHAAASESSRAIRAMLDRAKSELPATPDQFNKQLFLLNCENGTLDLRTGELRQHNPHDMLTRCLKTAYKPHAEAPQWLQFVKTIFADDTSLIGFVQTALGMSLSGDIREQCWFLCHGDGNNGKTTLLETPRTIMEDYGLAANIESFLVRKEAQNYDKAEFYGKRMITASEIPPKSRLNEAFMKKITGGEDLRAARKFENEFSFTPECTVWLSVNHRPIVKDTSKGMWRRVRYIPFNVTIPDKEVDTELPRKLLEEAEGILTWLAAGCIKWYAQRRLIVPEVVKEATKEYQNEQNTIARFFAEECDLVSNGKTFTKDLNARYEWWCDQKQEKPDIDALKEALNKKDLHSKRSTGGKWRYEGIQLKPMDGPSPDSSDDSAKSSKQKSDGSDGSDVNEGKYNARDIDNETLPQNMSLPSLPSLSEHERAKKSDGTITQPDELLLTFSRYLRNDAHTGEMEWDVPASGLPSEKVARSEYHRRLIQCVKSADAACIQAAVTIMQEYLAAKGVQA